MQLDSSLKPIHFSGHQQSPAPLCVHLLLSSTMIFCMSIFLNHVYSCFCFQLQLPLSPLLLLPHLPPHRELIWAPGRDRRPTAPGPLLVDDSCAAWSVWGALAVKLGSNPGAWASFSETIPYGWMLYSCWFNKNFILGHIQRCPIIDPFAKSLHEM